MKAFIKLGDRYFNLDAIVHVAPQRDETAIVYLVSGLNVVISATHWALLESRIGGGQDA